MADDLSIKVSLHDVIKTTKASKEITLDLKKNIEQDNSAKQ